jgi:hypothetical protein
MDKPDIDGLFADFAACYRTGTAPHALDYLERAGEGADALSEMIRMFLITAPLPDPTPVTAALARARVERGARSPALADALAVARDRIGLRKADVGRRLADALGFPTEASRVKGYYSDLENGNLDPRDLHERVITALSEVLSAPKRLLEALQRTEWIPPSRLENPGFGRSTLTAATSVVEPRLPRSRDELGELFLGPV